jgi:SAM-dependent methyltransferase
VAVPVLLGAVARLAARLTVGPWDRSETVRGFVESPPNATLLRFADEERARHTRPPRALDLGCGAGRNAVPLARTGWEVIGVDTSAPMLVAAAARVSDVGAGRLRLVYATMSRLPFARAQFDLVIAHGIWNLATTDAEFRRAIRDAARVSRPGAALFVFTFSRHTVPPAAAPVAGQSLIFDGFSGSPQCFLTAEQLVSELATVGFDPDPAVPLTEHNRSVTPRLASTAPVIYEGAFRHTK